MILLVCLYILLFTFTCFEVSCDFIYEDSIFVTTIILLENLDFADDFIFGFPNKKAELSKNIFWGSEIFLGMDNFQFWEGKMQNPFWKIWRSIMQ